MSISIYPPWRIKLVNCAVLQVLVVGEQDGFGNNVRSNRMSVIDLIAEKNVTGLRVT